MRSLQASPSARWERTASVLAEEGYAGWAISLKLAWLSASILFYSRGVGRRTCCTAFHGADADARLSGGCELSLDHSSISDSTLPSADAAAWHLMGNACSFERWRDADGRGWSGCQFGHDALEPFQVCTARVQVRRRLVKLPKNPCESSRPFASDHQLDTFVVQQRLRDAVPVVRGDPR